MSRERLAAAYDALAEAYAQVAHELRGAEQPERVPSAPAPTQAAGRPASPSRATPAAAAFDTSECPKHHVPFEQGTYGPYCKQITDDPAWAKHKTDRDGNPIMYCKLTPKNAPDWIKVHGAARPAPRPQMDDEEGLPF